ncbi:TPA: hypothetical protein ENS27_10685, partial [bacterium]|nr:hypothetical protein [bacterium]
ENSLSKIKEILHSFANPNMVDKNDCLLVYFSGHGQTVPLPRGAGEMGFLIPYDAKIESLTKEPNPAEYMQYCIAMNELNEISKTIPAKHIIFIIDACYSGLSLSSYGRGFPTNIPGYLSKVAKTETQQMITAGGKGEESEERTDLGHGVFTYKLLKGLDDELADANNDGVITGTELSTYLTESVRQMTNGKQNPRFGRYEEGEFLFIPQKSEPLVGKLKIQLEPNDALATIKSVDLSPEKSFCMSEGEIELPVGTYNVVAEKDGYENANRDQIKIIKGSSTTVKLILKQKPSMTATIDGRYLPKGTKTYIDNILVELPYKIPSGSYNFRFERDGYNSVDLTETLKAGQTFSPNPKWAVLSPPTKTNGSLQVKITPIDASISVTSFDTGKSYDVSPSGEIDLPPGSYTVIAKRDGYMSEVKEFSIIAGKQTSLALTMRPKQPDQALATIQAERLPFDARVFVNGSSVTLPHLVMPGTYGIRIVRNGYKPYDKRENLSSGQVLNLSPLWIPETTKTGLSPALAMGASAVVPGLGQHLQGQKTRGIAYEAIIAGVGIYTLIATIQHNSTLDDYEIIRNELESKSKIGTYMNSDIKSLIEQQNKAYDKATSAKSMAIVAQVLLGVAWGVNAIDAGFLTKPNPTSSGFALEIRPINDGSMIIARSSF